MSEHTEPGLYPDINFADYQALPFVNHTKLRWGEKSPRHMDWALRGLLDRKSTESMLMGRLIHCAVLEGMDQAEFRFPLAEPCGVPRKSGANKGVPCGNSSTRQLNGEWFCGVHAPEGATTLEDYATEADFETVKQLNHELRLHPVVKLLRQFGGCELTFIADIDGVPQDLLADPEEVAQIRKARQQAMQQQQEMKMIQDAANVVKTGSEIGSNAAGALPDMMGAISGQA